MWGKRNWRRREMREGTKSVLFAEHNFIHSILIVLSWKKLYKKYPKLWEVVCIFLHDIGLVGCNYLTDLTNDNHELLGAKIAGFLFGEKGYNLVWGHRSSNIPNSRLEAPDDFSWCIAPIWWLKLSWLIQNKKTIEPVRWKILLCERWIRRFQGENPSSLWETIIIDELKTK